ncbi:hypothetical protein ABK040_010357 [Willaertia magna]
MTSNLQQQFFQISHPTQITKKNYQKIKLLSTVFQAPTLEEDESIFSLNFSHFEAIFDRIELTKVKLSFLPKPFVFLNLLRYIEDKSILVFPYCLKDQLVLYEGLGIDSDYLDCLDQTRVHPSLQIISGIDFQGRKTNFSLVSEDKTLFLALDGKKITKWKFQLDGAITFTTESSKYYFHDCFSNFVCIGLGDVILETSRNTVGKFV